MLWLTILLLGFPVAVLAQIGQADQLDCSFDQQTFCNWVNALNGNEDDFDWAIADQVRIDGYHSIPRTLTGTGYFAYAQGQFRSTDSIGARAWLRSPVLDGLAQPATLSFSYWKAAAPPVLQVCTRDAGATTLTCVDTLSGLGQQQWVRRAVTIPASPLPFQIILVASGFRSALDTIGLDDIAFQRNLLDQVKRFRPPPGVNGLGLRPGESDPGPLFGVDLRPPVFPLDPSGAQFPDATGFLDGVYGPNIVAPTAATTQVYAIQQTTPQQPYVLQSASPRTQPVYGTTRPYQPSIYATVTYAPPTVTYAPAPTTVSGSCPAVACTFDHDLCAWYNDFKSEFDWKVRNSGTYYEGIPAAVGRPSYVFINGDARKPDQRASLRSGEFIIPQGAFLEFYTYNTDANTGQLSIYRNDPFNPRNIVWQQLGRESGSGWQRVRVALPAASIPLSLIFVGSMVVTGQYIGLDDIRLVDSSGREIGCEIFGTFSYVTDAYQAQDSSRGAGFGTERGGIALQRPEAQLSKIPELSPNWVPAQEIELGKGQPQVVIPVWEPQSAALRQRSLFEGLVSPQTNFVAQHDAHYQPSLAAGWPLYFGGSNPSLLSAYPYRRHAREPASSSSALGVVNDTPLWFFGHTPIWGGRKRRRTTDS